MTLTEQQRAELRQAIAAYDYPKDTYDYERHLPMKHPTMRELEDSVRNQLLTASPQRVKDGLSNVLYWGHLSAGGRGRDENFRRKVSIGQIRKAMALFRMLQGPGLKELAKLKLPEYSQLSFLSKLRMFLDPTQHVVLDLQLARLQNARANTLFRRLKLYAKPDQQARYIPSTQRNVDVYRDWCALCVRTARKELPGKGAIAVDVERGIFHLAQSNPGKAAALVAALERCYLSPGG